MSLTYEIILELEGDVTLYYYRHSKQHRVNAPAGVWAVGHLFWYQYGKRHNIHNPAIIYQTGQESYYHRGSYVPQPSTMKL